MTAPGTASSLGFTQRAPLPAWAGRLLWLAFTIGATVATARLELSNKADKSEVAAVAYKHKSEVEAVAHKLDRVLDLLCYDKTPQPRPCMDGRE